MKSLFLGSILLFSVQAFSLENVVEFSEVFRAKSCESSREKAAARASQQIESGSDTYDGPVAKFRSQKIIRFVQSFQGCEVLWSDTQGRLYDYYLRVHVAAK